MKTKRIIILTLIIVIFGLISVYSSSHVWAPYIILNVKRFLLVLGLLRCL